MPKKDYYETLGVAKGATIEEIKKAYRKQALQHHPDRHKGDKNAEARFKEVNEAYQVLSDPAKRQQYDAYGSYQDQPGGGGGQGFGGFDFSGFQGGGQNFGFEDIFESFFGGSGRSRSKRSSRGEDLNMQMRISFEDAVFGMEKQVTIPRKDNCKDCTGSGVEPGSKMVNCTACGGTGQVEYIQRSFLGNIRSVSACTTCGGEGKRPEKSCGHCNGQGRVDAADTITIRIPAGVEDQTTLRVTGKGNAGKKGQTNGDLYLLIFVEPSKKFKRDGMNIYALLEISNVQAVLGDTLEIDTVHGKKEIKIPKGIQEGEMIRLKGLGIKKDVNTVGDHFLETHIKIPKKLSHKEEELYQELKKIGQGKKGWFN